MKLLPIGGCGRNADYSAPPRADPYVRNYRIRLLHQVKHTTSHLGMGVKHAPLEQKSQ